jgi:YqjK-like protein
MNARLALLRQRRELLVLRARLQRLEIQAIAQDWSKPLAFADSLVAAARRARRFWLLYALALALFVRSRRMSLGIWIGRLWTAWEIYRALRPRDRRDSAGRALVRTR